MITGLQECHGAACVHWVDGGSRSGAAQERAGVQPTWGVSGYSAGCVHVHMRTGRCGGVRMGASAITSSALSAPSLW